MFSEILFPEIKFPENFEGGMSSSSLFCAHGPLGSSFAFVPQVGPEALFKRLSEVPKLAGVTPASRLESRAAPETISSGILEIDNLIGGLPRGCLTEVCGPASSGRTSLLLGAIAAATQHQEICALVDTSDALDPPSAAAAGVDLERVLWVRCCDSSWRGQGFNRADKASLKTRALVPQERRNNKAEGAVEQALRVTDLLLQSGGFGLIAIDLGDVPIKTARRIPLTSWFRFRRAVEHTPTVLLVISQQSCAHTCASLLLRLEGEKLSALSYQRSVNAHFGNALDSIVRVSRAEEVFANPGTSACEVPNHAQLLQGLSIRAEVLRSRLERKPVKSDRAAFKTKMFWAG